MKGSPNAHESIQRTAGGCLRLAFLSYRPAGTPSSNTRTAAPAGVMTGALPPYPRDLTHWGRQHGVGGCGKATLTSCKLGMPPRRIATVSWVNRKIENDLCGRRFGRGRKNHIRPQEFLPSPPKPSPSISFSPHFLPRDFVHRLACHLKSAGVPISCSDASAIFACRQRLQPSEACPPESVFDSAP